MKVRFWKKDKETGVIMKGLSTKVTNIEDKITGVAKMVK